MRDKSAKKLVKDKVALWICQICEYPNTIDIPFCQNIRGLGVDDKYKDKNKGCSNKVEFEDNLKMEEID